MLKWHTPSMLCDKQGRMCCIGFLAESYGVPKKALFGNAVLEDCVTSQDVPLDEQVLDWFYIRNDSIQPTNAEREKMLSKRFRHYDIEVEFVGEYP